MDVFTHIRIIIGIILSISVAHLLKGTVKIIQHPGRTKPYWVHLLWSLYIFLLLIHFWWWEYKLKGISEWLFPEYFFVIIYITIFYIICALLYPDDLNDYKDYKDYFYSRKKWFFGVLAASFAADIVDTLIKGKAYLMHFHWEYPVRNITHLILCIIAMNTKNKKFHAILVILFIVYELSYIMRLFFTA